MSKQTAVEWLIDQLKEYDFADITDKENWIIKMPVWILTEKEEQAKAMEKEQIIEANRDGVDMVMLEKNFVTGEQYYNETYGGDK
jgi:hypothetical protein